MFTFIQDKKINGETNRDSHDNIQQVPPCQDDSKLSQIESQNLKDIMINWFLLYPLEMKIQRMSLIWLHLDI